MFTATYSSEKIRKALVTYQELKSFRKAALKIGISKSTIHRWWHSFHMLLGVRSRHQKRKKRRPRKRKFDGLVQRLQEIFSSQTTLQYHTLRAIRALLPENMQPSISHLHTCLRSARVSRRRFTSTKVCGRSSEDMRRLIQEFGQQLATFEDDEIICIDETGFCNVGNALYSYFPKGRNPNATIVTKREKRSVIAAIHSEQGLIATATQTHAFKRPTFLKYVVENLLPMVPHRVKVAIMDNVSFHKGDAVRHAFERRGIQILFIPPYSPRCNPIEEVFSLAKRIFRASSVDDFSSRIQDTLAFVQSEYKNLSNYYKHTRRYVTCYAS
jgi:transposase